MNPYEIQCAMNDKSTENVWPELDLLILEPTVVVTTFRKSGVGVPTGVCMLKIDCRYIFTTPSSTLKVKRLSHTKRVTLSAGDKRGRATGGLTIEAIASSYSDSTTLPKFKKLLRARIPVMSRVIEAMYMVKKDQRLMYEITRPHGQ
jgi:uncharacterized protein